MSKTRYITATFSNGSVVGRTTTNPNLAFGWHATGSHKDGISNQSNGGFAKSRELAERAARQYGKWWPFNFSSEVVEVAVFDKKPRS